MGRLTHLQALEAESIFVLREVAATCEKPVLLYSIGKDSAVLLHLAMKAFAPGKPPFPLLHVDTGWKFREMIAFRDLTAKRLGLDLIVHVNEEGVKAGVNPITSGSAVHTDVMKTQGLKQALDLYAQAQAAGRPFEVVIMDLTVPGAMGGREATARLLEQDPHARIVVSSGYSNDPVMSDPARYGFTGILRKPYTKDDLNVVVVEQLAARRATSASGVKGEVEA